MSVTTSASHASSRATPSRFSPSGWASSCSILHRYHVPDMLDRIQVWGPPWLLHSLNSNVLKELGHHPSSLGTGIVIHENDLFSHIFANGTTIVRGLHPCTSLLLLLPLGPSTVAIGDASPCHDAASSLTVVFCNPGVYKSLSWSPPDSVFSLYNKQLAYNSNAKTPSK